MPDDCMDSINCSLFMARKVMKQLVFADPTLD